MQLKQQIYKLILLRTTLTYGNYYYYCYYYYFFFSAPGISDTEGEE